ncbi:hypothetical protein M9458_057028 [Cirrhinus mrigala]|uniref:Peptidase S1 domain-containing protein n=1 Tax=Cirrhinus mrigala TaxID=683832 RepID=A0ABD0MFZ0_CIRMR
MLLCARGSVHCLQVNGCKLIKWHKSLWFGNLKPSTEASSSHKSYQIFVSYCYHKLKVTSYGKISVSTGEPIDSLIVFIMIIFSLLLLASLLPQVTCIVNGWETKPHFRPYMVSIQMQEQHICGGFLISDRFVMTAASCRKR